MNEQDALLKHQAYLGRALMQATELRIVVSSGAIEHMSGETLAVCLDGLEAGKEPRWPEGVVLNGQVLEEKRAWRGWALDGVLMTIETVSRAVEQAFGRAWVNATVEPISQDGDDAFVFRCRVLVDEQDPQRIEAARREVRDIMPAWVELDMDVVQRVSEPGSVERASQQSLATVGGTWFRGQVGGGMRHHGSLPRREGDDGVVSMPETDATGGQ